MATISLCDPAITEVILREISLVRAQFPWMPWVGVRYKAGTVLTYGYDHRARCHVVYTNGITSRTVIRHEMGHFWANLLGTRIPGFNVYQALGVDESHPQRHEIAAEIFSRALGEPPLYDGVINSPDLRAYSEPTEARVAFIKSSGDLPDTLYEEILLGSNSSSFWGRVDIPPWFKDWAVNYQEWLRLNVLKFLWLAD